MFQASDLIDCDELLHFYTWIMLSDLNSLCIFSHTLNLKQFFMNPSHFILMALRTKELLHVGKKGNQTNINT